MRPTLADTVFKWDRVGLATDQRQYEAIKITFPELKYFAPPGTKYLTNEISVFITTSTNTILTDEQVRLIQNNIRSALRTQYNAILAKQELFKTFGDAMEYPAPNYEDLMQLIQAVPRGLFAAGVVGAQAKLDGGLANWVFQEGLGIDPKLLKANSTLDFKLNKNWVDIKVTGGIDIVYGSDRMSFRPSVTFDGHGFSKASINFIIKW